jgi:hypothetical protein
MRNFAVAAMIVAMLPHQGALAQGIANRTIGYVLTNKYWAVYQTPDGKAECPQGLNDGPREQFKALFPNDGKTRTLAETQLARESDVWFPADQEPSTAKGPLPYKFATGKTAIGLNLDGKIGPNDFTSPDGEPGIDNQLFRVLGCVPGFRGPEGADYFFENDYGQRYIFNRVLIELTNVDSLENDDDVTVTIYRGLDSLLTSANGKDFIPGGTQRTDERWGKRYIRRLKGKIVNGVLTTEPTDIKLPWTMTFDTNPDQSFKAARFRLKLTATSAEGVLGAYVPVADWGHRFQINWSTHHASYGQMSTPSIIRAMREMADAYPDPQTGKNTAISAAATMKFVQAYIVHPAQPGPVADAQ